MEEPSLNELISQQAKHVKGRLKESHWDYSRGVYLGAAGFSAAVVLILIQMESLTKLQEVAFFCAATAIPIWLFLWQVGETYAFYGEASYEHYTQLKNFSISLKAFLVAGLLLVASFSLLMWGVSKITSIVFLVASLVVLIFISRYAEDVKKYLKTNSDEAFLLNPSLIRTIPDYPKPGIQFRDITTLLKDPKGLAMVVDGLAEHYQNQKIDKIAGIEARGFIIGAALAYQLGIGFVPLRKPNKLPAKTISQEYQLEYGADALEVHTDAIAQGEQVLLVDDLIATGGTAQAGVALIQQLGGVVVSCAFVIDLPDLGGMKALQESGIDTFSLCEFEGA